MASHVIALVLRGGCGLLGHNQCRIYMTVSNNTVTSVFDDTISVIGGTYEDDELTMTSTYGKLSFKVTSLGSIMSGKCWLKGTVTGSEDKIDVTWRM